jgi:hypothetical protein
MSINALADIAVMRDETEPRRVVKRGRRGARRAAEPAAAAVDATQLPQQSYTDALIAAIPTEVLGVYTFVLTGIIGNTDLVGHDQLLARWLLYVAGFVVIAATLIRTYATRRHTRKRRFPVAELVAAFIGFAAWGLVMPGSPLMAVLSQRHAQMWTAIIIGAGATLLYLATGRLTSPASTK